MKEQKFESFSVSKQREQTTQNQKNEYNDLIQTAVEE